jgi:hypothetical protein
LIRACDALENPRGRLPDDDKRLIIMQILAPKESAPYPAASLTIPRIAAERRRRRRRS